MNITSSGRNAIMVMGSIILLFIAICSIAQSPKKPAPKPQAKTNSQAPAAQAKAADEPQTFKFVEQMPEFKGNISDWLGAHLVYPDSARAHNIEGRSVVEFVVAEDGRIINPKIIRTSGNSYLDAEAMRAVQMMPPWKPGRQQGKQVRTYYTLPISFTLAD